MVSAYSMIALLLGIAGVLFSWIPLLGIALAIGALALSIIDNRRQRSGLSMAALFLSLVSVTVSALFNVGILLAWILT